MNFITLFACVFLIVVLQVTISSAKKPDNRNKKQEDNKNPDIKVNDEHDEFPSLSSELQQLRELASKESRSIILTTKKPKHSRRKNKHRTHRRPHSRRAGGGRPNKKIRTRPGDILKAEKEVEGGGSQGIIESEKQATSGRKNRPRESRHLETLDTDSTHHVKHHNHHNHRLQQRRRAARRNKHGHHSHKHNNANKENHLVGQQTTFQANGKE